MSGLTVELKRLEGPIDLTFATKEEAEEHGLQMCKAWIDERTLNLREKAKLA